MIKQRQLNTTKRHFNTKIKDAKDLLNNANEVNEITFGILTVCGEGLEENLEKYIKELENVTETLSENEEKKKYLKTMKTLR